MACCRNCKFFQLLVRPDGKCLRLDGFTFEGAPACALFEERDYVKHELFERPEKDVGGEQIMEKMEYALENIVFYNDHFQWLEKLADELDATPKSETYVSKIPICEWHTEKHMIWMLLVGMFGEWGTSIRGGWIEETKACASYIRELCRRAKDEQEEPIKHIHLDKPKNIIPKIDEKGNVMISETTKAIIVQVEKFDYEIEKQIRNIAISNGIDDAYVLNRNTIVEALRKQVPRKPMFIDGDYDMPLCPKCTMVLGTVSKEVYCPVCGQRLEWEGEE